MCAYVQLLFLHEFSLLFDRIWANAYDSHLVRLQLLYI